MKRNVFLLGLLGAVAAKAQSLFYLGVCPAMERDPSATCNAQHRKLGSFLVHPESLKPKPGQCPQDGTKGESAGVLLTAQGLSDMMNYVLADGAGEFTLNAKSVLRCPHCGLLFVYIEVEP